MATIATRINSSGTYFVNGTFDEITYNRTSPVIKNLLTSTEEINLWGTYLNLVTADQTAAPNATLTAERIQVDPTGYTAIVSIPTIVGAVYTFSLWVKSYTGSSGTWGVNWYSNSSGHHRTTFPITGEWARHSFTFTADNFQTNVYVADNRSGLATITDGYVWGAQFEIAANATIYQGITSSGTLITPTFKNKVTSDAVYVTDIFDEVTYNTSSGVVKNLLSWSEYFKAWEVGDQSGWFYNLTPNQVTFNVIAGPAPNTLAGKLIDIPAALGSQIHRIYTNSAPFTSGVTYTLSIYAKAAERTKFMMFHEETLGRVGIDVDLEAVTATASNGSPTNIFINSAGNGWYRAGFTFTATQTGNTVVTIVRMRNAASAATYIGDGSSGIYVWGVQLEESSSATSYQGNGIRTSTVFGTNATPLSPGFVKREDINGSIYVTGTFDEVTGIT
jgi:hypothetical protein